jgi:ubiquinone/menaquinone biosynthesis C-methylase UbiE
MNTLLQEQQASTAFSTQAPVFDKIDEENKLIVWMRRRIHREVMSHIHKGQHMLELNCGTGIDAIYFASQGIKVKATDNAPGMLEQLIQKVVARGLDHQISVERCSFNNLDTLQEQGPFDYVFSDFGGLNCTDRLDKVLSDIDSLLKPGGRFSLVIMPKVCLWEMAMVFRGYFKTAFRRLRKGGSQAQVEGVPFQCYYYNPHYIVKHMGDKYRLLSLKGLSVTVPPPYIEYFVERYPKWFSLLERWENRLWSKAPFNRWGDHFIITMEKLAES